MEITDHVDKWPEAPEWALQPGDRASMDEIVRFVNEAEVQGWAVRLAHSPDEKTPDDNRVFIKEISYCIAPSWEPGLGMMLGVYAE